MFNLGFNELFVLLIVAVIVLGPKELPRYLRQAGRMAGRLRNYAFELRAKSGIDELLRSEGLDRDIADIRRLARFARGEVQGVVGAVSRAAQGGKWLNAMDAETVPYPESEAQSPIADGLLKSENEFPSIGADSYGALPDDASIDGELPASPLATDVVYSQGETDAPPREPTERS